ncbi:LytR/AlgR family response regulator transcription factor [Anaerosporobacter sp.]|uniref:LytR/AlgR family response regulator transcription factor n=1 Tax=Anaerosporobacter sp. TaxID=1872529 RepID=UPI00286EECFD|nr:LytTR family DNA-binding domain-containing protein [Anaerosporobacter sp.]
MKICVVEDEEVWRNKIGEIIEKYCDEKNILFQIHLCSNGKDFMKNKDADLVFLDIELAEGENGFGIAEKLIDTGKQCKICFLTSHTELARWGYRVNAFRYIDKKHLEEMTEALDSFVKTKIQERNIFCNDIFGICRKIKLDTLLLIETSGRKLRYLMVEGNECFCEGSISEMSKKLEQFGFFQIQRSYIVNMKYIEKVDSRKITLCNGLEIAIGRTRSNEFKKEFFKWRMVFDN